MSSGKTFQAPGLAPFSEATTRRRRQSEKVTYLAMAELYCLKKHPDRPKIRVTADEVGADPKFRGWLLCETCRKRALGVVKRTDRCPHMAYKTFCHECPRPCHPPSEEDRDMMKFSGPRLMGRHPVLAFRFFGYLLRTKYRHAKALRKLHTSQSGERPATGRPRSDQ